jgi:hypothetical protein
MKLTTSFRSADLGRKALAPRASTPCASVLLPVPESTTMRAAGKRSRNSASPLRPWVSGSARSSSTRPMLAWWVSYRASASADVAGLEDLDVRAGRRGLRLHQRADAQAQQVVVVHDQDRRGRAGGCAGLRGRATGVRVAKSRWSHAPILAA